MNSNLVYTLFILSCLVDGGYVIDLKMENECILKLQVLRYGKILMDKLTFLSWELVVEAMSLGSDSTLNPKILM